MPINADVDNSGWTYVANKIFKNRSIEDHAGSQVRGRAKGFYGKTLFYARTHVHVCKGQTIPMVRVGIVFVEHSFLTQVLCHDMYAYRHVMLLHIHLYEFDVSI